MLRIGAVFALLWGVGLLNEPINSINNTCPLINLVLNLSNIQCFKAAA